MNAEKMFSQQMLNEECMDAVNRLVAEVQVGWETAEKAGWVSEEDAYTLLGLK